MQDAIFLVPTPLILQKVVTGIDSLPMKDRDTKGDVYEYLLSKLSTAGTNGQFRTPRHIIRMMVELMKPNAQNVIVDPACGSAGFLVEAGEYLRKNHKEIFNDKEEKEHFNNTMLYGFDIDTTMLRISAMNLMQHGIENPNIEYKNIFVSDIEYIHTIRDNIKQGKNIEFYRSVFKIKKEVNDIDLYERICDKICEKYGLNADTIQKKEEDIKQIKYHLHRYAPNVKYGDFVRMYKFEHELRLMLLKYTLIIEESMKNIFISYLNDKKAKADYLVNMNNYNTSFIRNKAFDTMKLVIGKYDNLKSKPIKRKRDQNITVPYWIIINELAMNQTYYAIAN